MRERARANLNRLDAQVSGKLLVDLSSVTCLQTMNAPIATRLHRQEENKVNADNARRARSRDRPETFIERARARDMLYRLAISDAVAVVQVRFDCSAELKHIDCFTELLHQHMTISI